MPIILQNGDEDTRKTRLRAFAELPFAVNTLAHVGKIGEFVEGSENFTCYVERMEQYFAANDITDKKVAVFLAVMGPQTYSLLRNIMTPDLPSTKTYDEIVTALKGHFMPEPLVIAERFKFHNRSQKEGESVADYVVGLKKLAARCEYGNFLQQALRDRLVFGLRNEFIQKKLLAVKDLTLDKTCEISVAMETAGRNTTEMKPGHVQADANKVFKGPRSRPPKRDLNKKAVTASKGGSTSSYQVKVDLNGTLVNMELDTGEAVSIVSYKACLSDLSLKPTGVKLKTYSGGQVEILGTVEVRESTGDIAFDHSQGRQTFFTWEELVEDYQAQLEADFRVHSDSREPTPTQFVSIEGLKSKYSRLFQKDVGAIEHFKAQIHLDPNVKPIFCKARPVPFALRESLEKELDRLESQRIISKVDRSDWATPIVIVPKADKSIWLCWDFKKTINQCLDAQQYPLPNVDDICLHSYLEENSSPSLIYLKPINSCCWTKNSPWKWTSECETAFLKCKERLSENTMLVHYDGNKQLKLACDASAYG
ncbi:uncharacterized protein [Argopecten irradians]|uniref:uncharacterized protein n=1 Tax=Argopecten irradians TaxID=31199 RepID=UPI0037157AB2